MCYGDFNSFFKKWLTIIKKEIKPLPSKRFQYFFEKIIDENPND